MAGFFFSPFETTMAAQTVHLLLLLLCPLILNTAAAGREITKCDILPGVELGIQERYDHAVIYFDSLRNLFPDNPAPHFFLATIWQTKMMDFETEKWRVLFLAEIDSTIKLSEKQLRQDPDDPESRFYLGSALSYKSFQLSREKKYLNALNLAIKGIHYIKQVIEQDSSFYDAYLGIGSYLYWRSYMTRKFSWLPFFSDQRAKGIKLISLSFEKGELSRWAALSNLAWIYIQEGRFKEAIESARLGLDQFPNARSFLWPLADAYYHNGEWHAALANYKTLLELVTNAEFNNHYNEIVLHLKIAQCFFALSMWPETRFHAGKVLSIVADAEVQSRLKPKQKEARRMLKRFDSISID